MSHPCVPQDPALNQQLAEQQAELVYQRQAAFRQQIGLVKAADGVDWASTNPNAPSNPTPLPPSPITPINPNPNPSASAASSIARASVNPSAGAMK